MGIYEELKARGLVAQVTDEEEVRELVNNGKATFYIGFDATADSLHVGHFMALNLMRRLQLAGNKPIALEASGGVNLSTVRSIAETGVHFISIGAITHSAPAVDFGLDFEPLT